MSTPIPSTDDGARAVSGSEAIAAARLELLAAARYKLAIHLPVLTADILSSPAELAELRRIAIAGRGAEIRIVLGDPDATLRMGHRLIDLAQRMPSVLRIRTLAEEDRSTETEASSWLLNDTSGYLFLPDADRWEGRAALKDGPGQTPLLLRFEQIWEHALPATQLQPLGL
ncbi:hypothetical protein [Dyella nitratireducens]|uniref:DUF7931 domain-containing protein n=1 Tax=Dyella nitratireducens TaxID=1849580 RepID=A0ABQ1FJ39_9GAMM|nr:hypothetical protein [Dyella nitratireducens]GGA17829.1 hypothetical protein GCM10010981_01990 [Dyella nitratireducens]GLQ44739.1 hypothetical protein GCM10007902_45890 [Dyella nitratireducens]